MDILCLCYGLAGHSHSERPAPTHWTALRGHRLLRTLPRKEVERLAWAGHWLRFPPERVVVRQGTPVEAVLFVVQGKAVAVMERPLPGSQDFEATVHFLDPGADIGLLSLVDGAPHPATVTTLTSLEVVAIPSGVLQESLRCHPSRYRALARAAVEDLRAYQRAWQPQWERHQGQQILC